MTSAREGRPGSAGARPSSGCSPQERLDVVNKSTVVEKLPEVVTWHEGLAGNLQVKWASPSAIHLHCPVFAKERGERPKRVRREPKPREVEILMARNTELEEELTDAKAFGKDPRWLADKIAGLKWEDKKDFADELVGKHFDWTLDLIKMLKWGEQHQHAIAMLFHASLQVNAVGPAIDVVARRQIAPNAATQHPVGNVNPTTNNQLHPANAPQRHPANAPAAHPINAPLRHPANAPTAGIEMETLFRS